MRLKSLSQWPIFSHRKTTVIRFSWVSFSRHVTQRPAFGLEVYPENALCENVNGKSIYNRYYVKQQGYVRILLCVMLHHHALVSRQLVPCCMCWCVTCPRWVIHALQTGCCHAFPGQHGKHSFVGKISRSRSAAIDVFLFIHNMHSRHA